MKGSNKLCVDNILHLHSNHLQILASKRATLVSISVVLFLSWPSTTRSLGSWNSNICRLMWPSPWFLLVPSLPGDECGWTNGNNVGLPQMKKANKTSREASYLWWQHLHYLTSILETTEKRRAAFVQCSVCPLLLLALLRQPTRFSAPFLLL